MPLLDPARMRSVNWSTGIHWSVQFLEPSGSTPTELAAAGFDGWFPATDVEENLATLNNHQIEAYMSSYEFPQGSEIFDVNVTFIDDMTQAVHEWIADWINNGILNYDQPGGPYLTPVRDAVKLLQVERLRPDGVWLRRSSYWVTPDGTLNWQGESGGGPESNSFRFSIHKTVSRELNQGAA